MTWTVEFEGTAAKEFRKLDPEARRRIRDYLENRVLASRDPRQLGKALRGKLTALWRYRVGDYRIVCEIRDHELIILVVPIAHRRRVYK